MSLIDTHAHLYLSEFDTDINAVLDRAMAAGIEKIFLPAIDSETHEHLKALCLKTTAPLLYPMMGLHPCSVKENYEQELAIALNYLKDGTQYYAVGEIGLDFYWDITHKAAQYEAFERQIQWAIGKRLPIVIHSRQSTAECIEVVRQYKGQISGIFHCFGGTIAEANAIIDLGFYIGIGGVATYKNGGLKEVLPHIDLSHIVLETDAPYLTPVPHRGKRNESSYLNIVCQAVASIKNKSYDEVATMTTANTIKVFGL